MASSSTSPYHQWLSTSDDQVTPDLIDDIFGSLPNDLWVASACVDRVLDDTEAQLRLVQHGLSRTERAIQRCNDIISLSSPPVGHVTSSQATTDALISHFRHTSDDAQLCAIRAILLERSDLLNTYVEVQKDFPQDAGEEPVDVDMDEWDDDPWADSASTKSRPTPRLSQSAPPPVSLKHFLENPILVSACTFASLQLFRPLQTLFRKHKPSLWPYRFKVLDCIPDHADPEACREVFPALDHNTNVEATPSYEPWRVESDVCEKEEVRCSVATCTGGGTSGEAPTEHDAAFMNDPLSPEELSTWYERRVERVVSASGLVDVALLLVQHASSQGIPSLDELGEELSLLSRLVYDAPQDPNLKDDWELSRWSSLDPLAAVKAYLRYSTPDTLPDDICRLVMPYLFVLEARAERAGNPDPSLPTRILYDYILTTSLENVACIFERSKPTIPTAQRIIKDDEDMARLALACLYGSNRMDEWPTMSRIFECLPAWDIEDDDGDEADTTVASLGAFLAPKASQPPVTPRDLLMFFKPLPINSLSRTLDILDVHLESGEILARWGAPAPLKWFLESGSNIQAQRTWANRMARRAGGSADRLDSVDGWEWMLEDMLKLTGGGEPGLRGAFCLLSKEETMSIFLSGMLSSGDISIAKSILRSSPRKLTLSDEAIENVCISVSREFYDNASSGNYKSGDMKLAYDCLDVPKPSRTIIKEKEFIEATSRICSFNVCSSPGTPISPLEIRLTKDRLTLVSRVLSSNSEAYKHNAVILDLCYKLGYKDDINAEVKVLAMLADTALQAEDFARAYENAERMVQILSALRNSYGPSATREDTLQEVTEVCWITCFQLGRHPEFDDLQKKMILLGNALEHCPVDKLHDVLSVWRKLEAEDLEQREEKLERRRSERTTAITGAKKKQPDAVKAWNGTGSSVASSLRARLQELHMPSPPMLNTPDAAALASKTFKSVAANFPFGGGVGHRRSPGSSDFDERGSARSEGSKRTDTSDVSAQASRVLSKGIGWLIGADEEF